ncbi:hypothetical protein SLE2022_274750 [Rubroshorea leprosula]
MGKKRPHHHHSPPSQPDPKKKSTPKLPVFASYLDAPSLLPKVKLLCEIIATTPSSSVETLLEDTGLRVSREDVENVLKLSYAFPGPAVKFFRWAGHQLHHQLSPYAWNLVVDMLGKNALFDAMWDAVKSMRREGLISLATFASIFSSYVIYDRVKEAIMTFKVMEQYGCPKDVVALNSLLSAICREGKTSEAVEFLRVAKNEIKPDVDTYAILLEGWENEGNVICSRETFMDMVVEIGWDPGNVPAYDSFLSTLLKGPDGMIEALKYLETMKERKCSPGVKFFNVALEDCLKNSDVRGARLLWEAMVVKMGFRPDSQMYNSMIALYCYTNNTDSAKKMLDDMVLYGVFPDAKSYNMLFQFLIKNRKLKEALAVFIEMVKNECFPSQANCAAAVRVFVENGDPYVAIKVWKFMIENYDSDLEETGNFLVVGLRDLNMLPEAVKYAEVMIERRIKLSSSSMSRLKQSLARERKEFVYEQLLTKWKAH